jgi:hypothetical protein
MGGVNGGGDWRGWRRNSPPAGLQIGGATLAPAARLVSLGSGWADLFALLCFGTKRYDLWVAVGNFCIILRSYRYGSWPGVAAINWVICTCGKLLRLENLHPKKIVWFGFYGCSREVGSKSSTKHTLSTRLRKVYE